ncbi:unnamed protein product [Diamesa hyperborea]
MYSSENKNSKMMPKQKNISAAALNQSESGFMSSDFTNSSDFSLNSIDRSSYSRRSSFQRNSYDSIHYDQKQTSEYGTLNNSSAFESPSKLSTNRTPKKRKILYNERDENSYYSENFVSPPKIQPKNQVNCAKLILKEKSSSENVILSSTPKANNTKLWSKFRSFHPEKLIGKSFGEDEPVQTESFSNFLPKSIAECSFIDNSFSITDSSFNFTNLLEHNQQQSVEDSKEIPGLNNLWMSKINTSTTAKKIETITSATPVNELKTLTNSTTSLTNVNQLRTVNYSGTTKLNILGILHQQQNLALDIILSSLNDIDLTSLCIVSKQYKDLVTTNKHAHSRKENYLKVKRSVKENKIPLSVSFKKQHPAPVYVGIKNLPKAFGDSNSNRMKLRPKPLYSPPVSPSKRLFHENQKVVRERKNCKIVKCPRCNKPSPIHTLKRRCSPRKKKLVAISYLLNKSPKNLLKFRPKTFLTKPSIDNQFALELFDTGSCSDSGSPSSLSSDEYSGTDVMNNDISIEFAVCSGIKCHFKFCLKCRCKFHPRKECGSISPPSPSKNQCSTNSSIACTKDSRKSLKRLVY